FLVELAAAIAGYVFKDKVHGLVEEGLGGGFLGQFSCCGVNNFTDWASVGNRTVPRSCCRVVSEACNARPGPATVFDKGCLPSLESWLRRNIVVLAAVALGIAFFEVLGVVFSCCLMRGIRSGYEVM
uniref:CD63 molecule n=1 Tax=Catharus ustulatus TaxID=91951 RepID=A0A8C3UA48_CATUS